jgi:hypothetical protein
MQSLSRELNRYSTAHKIQRSITASAIALPSITSAHFFFQKYFKYYPAVYDKYLTVVSLLCGFLTTFCVRSAMGAVCPTNLFLLHLMAVHYIRFMPFLFSHNKMSFVFKYRILSTYSIIGLHITTCMSDYRRVLD